MVDAKLEKGRTRFGNPVSHSGRINALITIAGSNPVLTTNKKVLKFLTNQNKCFTFVEELQIILKE